MCCRIFNSTAADFPVTGRNMNWMWSFDTFLYSTPKHLIKQGLSDSYCQNEGLEPSQVFTWQSTYASISTIIYGEHVEQKKSISSKVAYRGFEYACADGMNEAGLTVNALADTNSEFGTPSDSDKQLSTLRWAQYILDSFATVAEAIIALQSPKYVLVDQGMPDASNKKGLFHMCLSDPSGDSAIVEYVNGEPVIYCDAQYRVVTNQPDYATQLILNNYWQFQWGVSTAHNNHPLQTAPGGHSSTQMFEQASYNLTYSVAQETAILATAQTRNLMGQVAVHLGFNSKKFDDIPLENRAYTIWTNLASTNDLQYYFINTLVGCGGYLEVRNNTRNTYRVKVMNKDKYDQDQFVAYIGDLSGQLEYFDVAPFEHRN
ncbi:MAG: hypothetical protein AXW14_09950 [Alteromonas sp. Nap_26]|nr:MAG: hypothetical protein AXW14_09950 [Alteromonas sp. Nap_26]